MQFSQYSIDPIRLEIKIAGIPIVATWCFGRIPGASELPTLNRCSSFPHLVSPISNIRLRSLWLRDKSI